MSLQEPTSGIWYNSTGTPSREYYGEVFHGDLIHHFDDYDNDRDLVVYQYASGKMTALDGHTDMGQEMLDKLLSIKADSSKCIHNFKG